MCVGCYGTYTFEDAQKLGYISKEITYDEWKVRSLASHERIKNPETLAPAKIENGNLVSPELKVNLWKAAFIVGLVEKRV